MRGPHLALIAALGCGAPNVSPEEPMHPTRAAPRSHEPPKRADGRVAARGLIHTADATCVLLEDRTVWCFGGLYAARVESGGVHQVPIPPVSGIVAAPANMAAWTVGGEVFEWGAGDGRRFLVPNKLPVEGARELALAEHALCVRFDDHVTCTGDSVPKVWTVDVAATAISIRMNDRCFATPYAVHCAGHGTSVVHPLSNVEELAASDRVTCARTSDRRVHCWSTADSDLPDRLFGARQFIGLEGNEHGVCALPLVGAPACVPETPGTARPAPDAPASFADVLGAQRGVTSMQRSYTGACFVAGGGVQCWEVGEREASPVDMGDLASLREAREVGVGLAHACMLGPDGVVRCWGAAAAGALGVGDEDKGPYATRWPERVVGFPPVARLRLGPHMTCVVTRAGRGPQDGSAHGANSSTREPAPEPGGRVFCTGSWTKHPAGIDCTSKEWPCTRTPTLVTEDATDVALGSTFGCVLGADRGVRCWGANDRGQLGAGDTVASGSPRSVVDASGAPITGARKLAAGDAHACALIDGGAVVCWGHDQPDTQSARLAAPARLFATPLSLPTPAVDVSDRCVLLEGGEMRCWGERPDRGSSKEPKRVGVCDATRLVGAGCALGPRGVTCIGRERSRLGEESGASALTTASAHAVRLCGVDAQNHVRCRRLDNDVPEIGDAILPILQPEPTAACPVDELDAAPAAPRGASPLHL